MVMGTVQGRSSISESGYDSLFRGDSGGHTNRVSLFANGRQLSKVAVSPPRGFLYSPGLMSDGKIHYQREYPNYSTVTGERVECSQGPELSGKAAADNASGTETLLTMGRGYLFQRKVSLLLQPGADIDGLTQKMAELSLTDRESKCVFTGYERHQKFNLVTDNNTFTKHSPFPALSGKNEAANFLTQLLESVNTKRKFYVLPSRDVYRDLDNLSAGVVEADAGVVARPQGMRVLQNSVLLGGISLGALLVGYSIYCLYPDEQGRGTGTCPRETVDFYRMAMTPGSTELISVNDNDSVMDTVTNLIFAGASVVLVNDLLLRNIHRVKSFIVNVSGKVVSLFLAAENPDS